MLQIMSSGRPFGQVNEDELESLRKNVQELKAQILRERGMVGTEQTSIMKLVESIDERLARLEKKEGQRIG